MDKDILIEIFKNKACSNVDSIPKDYCRGYGFDFWYNSDLVDIRIFQEENKYHIQYESISFKITKSEYVELFLLYDIKKKCVDKIIEEEKRQTHIKNSNSLTEIYQQIICQKRKVLIEKNITNEN
nr:hypothetical protein [uncultured archaeon]